MTLIFFRHDISVFNMLSTLMTSVIFTWHLHLWHQCFSDMTPTFMTLVIFTCYLHLWHQCFSVMTPTLMTSVVFTWHLHSWHQCFSDMTPTFMTSLFFRHDIYIYHISVFQTWHQCFSLYNIHDVINWHFIRNILLVLYKMFKIFWPKKCHQWY